MTITAEEVLAEIGPVQEILDEHDGVVTVLDTSDGNIMLSLDGGCNGCSSTPMTAMQIYYSLKKLEASQRRHLRERRVAGVHANLHRPKNGQRSHGWQLHC